MWFQGKKTRLDPARIPEFTDIITADPHLTEILSWLPIYAESDLPILLTGEPGTGKELVAMALFALGPSRRRTCQRLNCAALTESLASQRAVRARAGGLYRRRSRPSGQIPVGPWRQPLPG